MQHAEGCVTPALSLVSCEVRGDFLPKGDELLQVVLLQEGNQKWPSLLTDHGVSCWLVGIFWN